MMHEFEKIVKAYKKNHKQGKASVLATVVDLEGTSYRQPGVRMLISEDGTMVGAVSGGCVEKEIYRQSASVFRDGVAKIMTYDGRFRLGCEGILYILIEPVNLSADFYKAFESSLLQRKALRLSSVYKREDQAIAKGFGTQVDFGDGTLRSISGSDTVEAVPQSKVFVQELPAALRLLIIGAEHDAVQLCSFASLSGWEVMVVATDSDPKELSNFPGAKQVVNTRAELFDTSLIDTRTAVMMMTHSYTKDLQYLLKMEDLEIPYIGLLGPSRRRERLLNELIEHRPEIATEFLDAMHGPAGINIGAETPQEIAISILAEMLSVFRGQEVIPLKDKVGRIHDA